MPAEAPRRFKTREELLEAVEFGPDFEQKVAHARSLFVGNPAAWLESDELSLTDLLAGNFWLEKGDPLTVAEFDVAIQHTKKQILEEAKDALNWICEAMEQDIPPETRSQYLPPVIKCLEVLGGKARFQETDEPMLEIDMGNFTLEIYPVGENGEPAQEPVKGNLLRAEDLHRIFGIAEHFGMWVRNYWDAAKSEKELAARGI